MAEVVQADVVGGRVAGDIVERLGLGHAVHGAADHRGHLALVVQEERAPGRRSTPPCPFRVEGGFMKYDGSAGTRAPYSARRLR